MKSAGTIHGLKAPSPDPRAQLLQMSKQLQAVFINQLFQAMRESVPDESPAGESSGREMFTSMLDEKLADAASQRMDHGISEALYRQLSRRLPDTSAAPAAAATPATRATPPTGERP